MEVDNDDVIVREGDDALKTKTPGAAGQDTQEQLTGLQLPVAENGIVFDQSAGAESSQISLDNSTQSDTTDCLPREVIVTGSSQFDTENDRHAASESISDTSVIDGVESASNLDVSHDVGVSESVTDSSAIDEVESASNLDISHDVAVSITSGDEIESNHHEVAVGASEDVCDDQHNHVLLDEEENGHAMNTSSESMHETSSEGGCVASSGMENGSLDPKLNSTKGEKPKCRVQGSVAPLDIEVICLDEDGESKDYDSSRMDAEDTDCQNVNGMKRGSQKRSAADDDVSQLGVQNGKKIANLHKTSKITSINDSIVYVDEESRHSEKQAGPERDHDSTDDEKENKGTSKSSSDVKELGGEWTKYPQIDLSGDNNKVNDNDIYCDSADDDVEIIGETKVVQVSKPSKSVHASQNIVFVPAGLPSMNHNSVAPSSSGQQPSSHGPTLVPGAGPYPAMLHSLTSASSSQRMPTLNPSFPVQQQKLMLSSVAPPQPQSSLDQIELIRWEIQNRVNTRPRYFKPNPDSELGPLAKFLFDIGSYLIKEAVYHDLVKIQSKKKNQNKLNDKEKEDLGKLKDIEKDMYATIGHLKTRLKRKCSMCNFRTESINVLFHHNQYPHEDSKGMRCSHCSFTTKQGLGFRLHMETSHRIPPRLHDKKATFECQLCPYENNHEQKLILHKQRCIKQFRPYFNLHPSCLSGSEINLCLENIFYKAVIAKNLPLPPQKYTHSQTTKTDAQKQRAETKSVTAQNPVPALSAKIQLTQRGRPPTKGPRITLPPNGRMPVPATLTQSQPMRYGFNAGTKNLRPTISIMINNQQTSAPLASLARTPAPPLGVFEVCEICGGFVKDRKALRIHFFYAHRIDLPFNLFERNQAPLYCATCYVRFWTAQGLRKHIDSHKEGNQSRGVVGKCILCSHHVLNLLLHMRLVHSRDWQHFLNLNTCMFCGLKTLSRRECENHIINTHGCVDPISGTLKPPSSAPIEPLKKQPQKSVAEPKKLGTKKRCMCVLCNLEFSRNVDLTRHCMRMHHTCMKCGMVVADKPSLAKHRCLLSSGGIRDCVVCGDKGYHPAYYIKHLRDKHLKKLSVRLTRLSKKTIELWTKRPCPVTERPCPVTEPKDILVEISDDDDVDSVKQHKSPSAIMAQNIPEVVCVDKLEKEEPVTSDKDTDLGEQTVIDIDTKQEVSEDDGSSETLQGYKRKSESPLSGTSPKRQKTP